MDDTYPKKKEAFLNNYLKEDVGPLIARNILEKIDQVTKSNWLKIDFHSNMHNVWVDLKQKEVNIAGLLDEDPEITISLKVYIQKLEELIQN